MSCKKELMRKLPGRIVGQTTDLDGERAFVLTLQAREQHIRREKSSSSLCSNQALCALTAAIYLGAMGPNGLSDVAVQSMSKAHYLADSLTKIDGFSLVYDGEFFNEFVTTCPVSADQLLEALEKQNILGGYPLEDGNILWCATEMNTKKEMDLLVSIVKQENFSQGGVSNG